jgi:Zn-dependent M28 family amino/carboxypeptidase
VELVAFAGEEQGLLGSKAYASMFASFFCLMETEGGLEELRTANASVILMIQADMTAYRAPGEPMQLGLPERYVTSSVGS